jgi:hypothetical protein
MTNIVNFKAEKDRRSSATSVDPVQHLESIKDQLISLNLAFDRLSDTLDDFGSRMNGFSKRLENIEEKTRK